MVTSSSETNIQNGKDFSYPSKIFTNLDLANTIILSDTNSEECVKKYDRCWCDKSEWNKDLIEVEASKAPTKNKSNKSKNLTVAVRPIRQPPPGWVEFRRQVTRQNIIGNNEDKFRNDNPIEKLIIKGTRSITTEEFKEM